MITFLSFRQMNFRPSTKNIVYIQDLRNGEINWDARFRIASHEAKVDKGLFVFCQSKLNALLNSNC